MGNHASLVAEDGAKIKRSNSAPSLVSSVSSAPSIGFTLKDLHHFPEFDPDTSESTMMMDRSRSSLGSSFSKLRRSSIDSSSSTNKSLTNDPAADPACDENNNDNLTESERRRQRRRKSRASTGDPRKDRRRRSHSGNRLLCRSLNSFMPHGHNNKQDDMDISASEMLATGEFLEKLMETPEGRARLKKVMMEKHVIEKVAL